MLMLQQYQQIKSNFRLQIRCQGGATKSIFMTTENMLRGNEDYIKAIEFQARLKKMEYYRDIIDFLFCEIFPKWKKHCFNFYNDKGPRLAQHPDVTVEMIVEWDRYMSNVVLPVALAAYREKLDCSWKGFMITINVVKRVAYNDMD